MAIREKKAAKTKLALLDAALELMTRRPFEEVAVAQICEVAEVSYATFFNYFGRKEDLLVYFVQLWSVETAHLAASVGGGLAGIERLFGHTAAQSELSPEIMEEIISFLAKKQNVARLTIKPLTDMEKRLRFPDIKDFAELEDTGMRAVLPPLIHQAVERGELPDGTDETEVLLALASIFMGAPVALAAGHMKGLGAAYSRQLSLLWGGLRAAKGVEQYRRNEK
ncbi:MAG: TetR/AcrR family transcriptional regulator [Nitrospinota bacterium]|nr:TetR/AcrR family transcriptional regulator [Nitrospinota bacterium]MDH5678310.1 TetR/AcrR family transcriptional regulator [Nitrospinota bacterium]